MQGKKIGIIFINSILVILLFTACSSQEDKNIELVRNGTMNMYPNVPIGKAFNQFFSNGKWKAFTSTDNKQIVEFNGNCYWLDETVPMKIQFTINNDSQFSLSYVGIDNVDIPQEVRADILYGILEKYQP